MKRSIRIQWLVVTVALTVASSLVGGEMFIVKDGKPNAEIVIAEKPTRSVKFAARELRDILKKISGAELSITNKATGEFPVKVYVGESAATKKLGLSNEELKHGAFRMVSGKDYLALIGRDDDFKPREPYAHDHTKAEKERVMKEWDELTGEKWGNPMLSVHRRYSPALDLWMEDERGSLNAVYAFLRRLGCRWYYPGDLGEILPTMKTIPLPKVDVTEKPDFPVRHLMFYYNEFWMARKGIPAGVDDVKWQLRLGLSPYQPVLGPGLGHGTMSVHSRPEVKKNHPDFYTIWNGKRTTEHMGHYGAGCLSSEGLFEKNVKYVRSLFDIYDVPMVSVAPADGYSCLCECEKCQGKDTPDRGWNGQLSDYVWDFTNRVAKEVYKTHPDKKIHCIAYSTYQLPPEKIDQLSPNIVVGICRWRSAFQNPKKKNEFRELREQWLKKLPSKQFFIWDYYRHGVNGKTFDGVPVYFTDAIAADLKSLKGISLGDYIEVYRRHSSQGKGKVISHGHLNDYVTARFLWDVDQDLDAVLEEYYEKFYGPAAKEMKTFVEYCQSNWSKAAKDGEVIDRMFELIGKAQNAAAGDPVVAQRVGLIMEDMERMRPLRKRLGKGRKGNPVVAVIKRKKPPKMDGNLDEPFWKDLKTYDLKNLQKGGSPTRATTFKAAWSEGALYFGVVCFDPKAKTMRVTATEPDDSKIWNNNNVELLLETQVRSYYQMAFSAAGAVFDMDRTEGFNTKWSSQAEVASTIGEDRWVLEIRLTAAGDAAADYDPLSGVAGDMPTKEKPWFFNLCRLWIDGDDKETSAFSPTLSDSFHDTLKFAKLYVKQNLDEH